MAFKKALSYSLLLLMLLASAVKAGVTVTFLHHDNLDSPVAATDENGDILWRETYAPFGEKAVKPSAASEERVGYTGKLHDNNTGLSYFNARYYDPVVGRFMAMDPVDYLGGGQQYFNRFSYAANNPYRYTDPSGQVLKAVKAVANIIGKAIKNGGNFGKATKDEAIDFYENFVELVDGDWTADDAFAVVDLATGFGGEARRVTNYVGVTKKTGVPDDDFVPNPNVTQQYTRPAGAGPTAAQKASVQGQPCVDCGAVTPKQVADHKDPLVVQHYREGSVNVQQQRELDAVQPHCPSCSSSQGGQLGAFSKKMKNVLGL